jgi:hypothetical protein
MRSYMMLSSRPLWYNNKGINGTINLSKESNSNQGIGLSSSIQSLKISKGSLLLGGWDLMK